MGTLKENVSQALTDCTQLISRINNFKMNAGYDKDDQRYISFEACENVINFTRIHLDYFLVEVFGKSPPLMKRVPGITTAKDFDIFRTNFDKFHKMCLLTTLMFQIEIFMKSISNKLQGVPKGPGYKKLVDHVLEEVNLSDWAKKSKIMNGPAKMRNVLHAQGRFTEKSNFEVDISGKLFRFESGKLINFIFWDNVFLFLNSMFDVVEEVLKSPKVVTMKKIDELS